MIAPDGLRPVFQPGSRAVSSIRGLQADANVGYVDIGYARLNHATGAKLAAGSLTGVARIQESGVYSNGKAFSVPVTGGGTAVALVPNLINMVIGDSHPIEALGSSSQSVTGLTWASSNSSIVSLSTEYGDALHQLVS